MSQVTASRQNTAQTLSSFCAAAEVRGARALWQPLKPTRPGRTLSGKVSPSPAAPLYPTWARRLEEETAVLWKLEAEPRPALSFCPGHTDQDSPLLPSLPPRREEGERSVFPVETGGPGPRVSPRQCHTPRPRSRSSTHLFIADCGPGGISHHKALGWGLGLFMGRGLHVHLHRLVVHHICKLQSHGPVRMWIGTVPQAGVTPPPPNSTSSCSTLSKVTSLFHGHRTWCFSTSLRTTNS